MKSKEELIGDYREMAEHNALHKDIVFLEVLIDIRDALSAMTKQLSKAPDPSDPCSP
jgi:hypothetical protein